jgi:hypothetical protein
MFNININKVVILSGKKEPSPEILAIASEFRDRLLVAFVPYEAKEVRAEFPNVTKTTDVIVYKSYDPV